MFVCDSYLFCAGTFVRARPRFCMRVSTTNSMYVSLFCVCFVNFCCAQMMKYLVLCGCDIRAHSDHQPGECLVACVRLDSDLMIVQARMRSHICCVTAAAKQRLSPAPWRCFVFSSTAVRLSLHLFVANSIVFQEFTRQSVQNTRCCSL